MNMNFLVINLKKYLFTCVFIIFTICLILFSGTNLVAARNGLALFATSVLPTLFPFFVATELLLKTNFINILGRFLNKFVKPIFNIPGESVIAIILGTISGYPIGAKVVCDLKREKRISKTEAERLISFTNNSGPLFILATVGIALYNDKKIGTILLVSHILASLSVGILFRFWKKNIPDFSNYTLSYPYKENNEENKLIKISEFGEILGEAIKKSILTILNIGGFIVLFSVIISILEASGIVTNITHSLSFLGFNEEILNSFFYGFIELTNGVNLSSKYFYVYPKMSIMITSFILGFGGISVLLQVYSIIAKEKISIKPYFYGKLLQGILSVIYTFILI